MGLERLRHKLTSTQHCVSKASNANPREHLFNPGDPRFRSMACRLNLEHSLQQSMLTFIARLPRYFGAPPAPRVSAVSLIKKVPHSRLNLPPTTQPSPRGSSRAPRDSSQQILPDQLTLGNKADLIRAFGVPRCPRHPIAHKRDALRM